MQEASGRHEIIHRPYICLCVSSMLPLPLLDSETVLNVDFRPAMQKVFKNSLFLKINLYYFFF